MYSEERPKVAGVLEGRDDRHQTLHNVRADVRRGGHHNDRLAGDHQLPDDLHMTDDRQQTAVHVHGENERYGASGQGGWSAIFAVLVVLIV